MKLPSRPGVGCAVHPHLTGISRDIKVAIHPERPRIRAQVSECARGCSSRTAELPRNHTDEAIMN